MKQLDCRTLSGRLSTLWVAFSLAAAAGCGGAVGPEQFGEGDEPAIGQVTRDITGGWTTLTLTNGWQNWSTSTPPAVGVVNGVVTFRGNLKGTSATSDSPFTLPAAFLADLTPRLNVRIVLSGGVGGTLHFEPDGSAHIYQDDVDPPGLGAAAKSLTSLDGAAFDESSGTELEPEGNWIGQYSYRNQGVQPPVSAKLVDGFVRFQGFLTKGGDPNDYDGFLFNLPTTLRPGNAVYVPADLCGVGGADQSWGQLTIYPSGDVFVNGNPPAANCGTSFEGVFYSKTLSGNISVPLENDWAAYSARSVKVGKYGDVVRFQGAISGGTSTTIATLPSGYRPPKTVFLVAATYGPSPARIYVTTTGAVVVDNPSLSVASLFLSLDGVSFAL